MIRQERCMFFLASFLISLSFKKALPSFGHLFFSPLNLSVIFLTIVFPVSVVITIHGIRHTGEKILHFTLTRKMLLPITECLLNTVRIIECLLSTRFTLECIQWWSGNVNQWRVKFYILYIYILVVTVNDNI